MRGRGEVANLRRRFSSSSFFSSSFFSSSSFSSSYSCSFSSCAYKDDSSLLPPVLLGERLDEGLVYEELPRGMFLGARPESRHGQHHEFARPPQAARRYGQRIAPVLRAGRRREAFVSAQPFRRSPQHLHGRRRGCRSRRTLRRRCRTSGEQHELAVVQQLGRGVLEEKRNAADRRRTTSSTSARRSTTTATTTASSTTFSIAIAIAIAIAIVISAVTGTGTAATVTAELTTAAPFHSGGGGVGRRIIEDAL